MGGDYHRSISVRALVFHRFWEDLAAQENLILAFGCALISDVFTASTFSLLILV